MSTPQNDSEESNEGGLSESDLMAIGFMDLKRLAASRGVKLSLGMTKADIVACIIGKNGSKKEKKIIQRPWVTDASLNAVGSTTKRYYKMLKFAKLPE